MAMRLPLLAAFLLLASCAAPGPYATPAPDTAAFLAQGTLAAVATAQQGTRVEYTRQAVAVGQATAQAVQATQAAVAVTQAAATATAATREAATAVAATGTAVASATHGAVYAQLTADAGPRVTRQAGAVETATATALVGATERDRAARTRGSVLGWLGLGALAGLLYVVLRLLYAAAAPRLWEARVIRNTRTGEPVAYRLKDGTLEYLMEPVTLPALPAPNGNGDEGDEPRIIDVNTPREPLYRHTDDFTLRGERGEVMLFSLRQRMKLKEWYEQGTTTIRRTTSDVGPGFNEIGIVGGDAYQLARKLLLHNGYIDEANEWTAAGVREFLGGGPPSVAVHRPSPSPSNGRQTVPGD